MPPARAAARGPSRAPARGGAPARPGGGATSAPAPGGAAVKVGGDAEKDPRFRKVIDQLEKGAKKTKQHPPAAQKAAEAQAAAVSPPTEQVAGAKANQVEAMKAAETPKADPNGFLTLLRAEIEKVMPKNLDDADKFMEGNETGQVKGAVSGGVKEQKDAAAGPTEQASAAPPDASAVPARQAEPLREEPAAPPPPVNGAEAMPAPKPASEVQALGKPKQDADQQMKDAELTPERLKKANDPRFSSVLTQKGTVEKLATAAPGKYVAAEGATLGTAKAKASGDAKAGVAQMGGVKLSGNSKVKARQLLAKQKDEARRKAVTDHIETLYQQTKQKVDTKLSTLETDVMRLFDLGAEAALADMKSYANREIDKFKDERYSGITGGARWLADLFRPVPEGIKVILGQARTRFASKMDALAVRISAMVDGRLAEAKAEVNKGQAAIKTYVDGLPKDLQAVGREAQQAMTERFEELRNGIDAKKNDLAQKLAQKYKEAHDKADSALKKLEEENAGALKKLADAIGEVIKILSEFKDKLMAVLRKGLETIKLILADPIGFLGNLLAAVKQGFNQFVGNIWTHLKKGFMQWLFGSLAEAGIQVPSDLNVWSILKLVLDVLGLTYAWMRSEAVKLMGERNVMLLEKLVEYITITIKGGPQALWDKLKEDLSNLKAMVIDAIQNWLIETIVKQAVTKILSMFNPAGAIVQAILAIYNVVMWVIENASRIVALIEAVVNSVHAIATGAIGGAAAWIEKALAGLIPIVIGFLARLIGLGGVSAKIKEFITNVQTKVRAAVLKWLKKAWEYVKKLFGRGGSKDKKGAEKPKVDIGFAMAGAGHQLTFEPRGGSVVVLMASEKLPLSDKFKIAHTAIDNFKYYMSSVAVPEVKTEWESKMLPDLERLQSSLVGRFRDIYEKRFKDKSISDEQAKAQVESLKKEAEKFLAQLVEWGSKTGIADLSKSSVEQTLRTKGDALWRAAWTQTKAAIDATVKGHSFRGQPVKYRGSAATGWRGPHKGQTHFDVKDFDVDLFVIHPAAFEEARRLRAPVLNGKIFAPSSRLEDLISAQTAVVGDLTARFPQVRKVRTSSLVLRRDAP